MSRKEKFLAKNARRIKEMERQTLALEKRALQNQGLKSEGDVNESSLEELGITDVEQGSLEISPGNKIVKYKNKEGVSETLDIEQVNVMHPDSDEWKAYVAAGGNPDIPKGQVPIQIVTKDTNLRHTINPSDFGFTAKDIEALEKAGAQLEAAQNNNVKTRDIPHNEMHDKMLPIIINDIHPDSRKVMSAEEALTHLDVQETDSFRDSPEVQSTLMSEKLFNQAKDRIKHAASIDPNEEILIKYGSSKYSSLAEYSGLTASDISPGIDNKELNFVYDLIADTTTRRIRFDQLNYPVWEGHDTHPTRNEGFITKPPFPNMYIQFDGFVNLPPMASEHFLLGSELYRPDMFHELIEQRQKLDGVPITREISISIGAMAFRDEIQHLLISKNSNGTARTVLPQEGKTWKITPPQGTTPNYDGYSSGTNDSIMLGYLQWFGLLMDSNHQGLAKINQGAYFDINTGAIWLPLTKITGGQSEEVIHASNVFQVEKNRMSTHLIPAGSGIESSVLSEGWGSDRKLNILEDTTMRVGDIFMFMMNYMTSPRMQTEEVQVNRGERRRAQKQGLPPPPPWTTISYKPPSSIKRNSVATGTGSKHSYMYDVRGHWKNQPHGPGREQRKLIWVHPHYSGLANEKYVPRHRLVQEKAEYEDIKIS